MPLSEHEQRILEEIEKRLAEEDPRLVESVSKASVAAHALRRIRWGLVGFVLGFILLLFFVASIWFAVGGFVVMLGSVAFAMQSYRHSQNRDLRAVGGTASRRTRPRRNSLIDRLEDRWRGRPEDRD